MDMGLEQIFLHSEHIVDLFHQAHLLHQPHHGFHVRLLMSPLPGRHQGEIMPESLLNFSSSEVDGIVCGC